MYNRWQKTEVRSERKKNTCDRDMKNKMPKDESKKNGKPSDYAKPNKSIKQKIWHSAVLSCPVVGRWKHFTRPPSFSVQNSLGVYSGAFFSSSMTSCV